MRIGLRSVAFSGAMILLCILAAGAFTGVTSSVAQAQQENTRPMTLDGLMAALRAGRGILPPSEYIQKIQKRGVSFEVTPGVERQLRQAGATSEIVQAARANYRGEHAQPKPQPAPAHEQQPASLLVICDLACNWKLDGGDKGRIEAGGSAKAQVVLGEHIVSASSIDGLDAMEVDRTVKEAGQSIVRIKLQPIRDARLAGQQSRQEHATDYTTGETWTDPSTRLMWTKKDNGSDIAWQQAIDYCQNLRLNGHSGWRLPTIDELEAIYDPSANVSSDGINWHVKGDLHLTGWHWSSTSKDASRGAWVFKFMFKESVPVFYDNPNNRHSQRALCVRRPG